MKAKIQVIAVAAVTVALFVVGAGFYNLGVRHGHTGGVAVATEQATDHDTRHQKILAVIVKRNPNATIREFANFPEVLIQESQRHGLDFRFVMAVIDKESEWNPRAVSHAGALGLMQVMPPTAALVVSRAKMNGYEAPSKGSLGSLGDPAWNVRIGVQYLRWKMDEFGLGPEHLRAYNRGDSQARAHWPQDRYAEDIALKFVALSVKLPNEQ